ncbi:hypothetical protein KDX38_23920 [Pseudomonas sp. CDFA 602]|uniref:hypothetical protein n=1 Tax=Pseudomonas californiensis TaxID=2829823 RepID=UPI001E2A1948|nr:hypothetical protein [Pseudomonas californiensis]MCD5996691.1 hypothetical protein [Pseudomonas californiensis]MCD6002238.1 hypothetical protein [Pseudomonas californiensis]
MIKNEKERELKAWHLLLEDDTYRLEFPDDFYLTLIRRADELVLREIIDLSEWQKLKDTAEAVHEKTLHSLSIRQRDSLNTVSIDLCIDASNNRTIKQ